MKKFLFAIVALALLPLAAKACDFVRVRSFIVPTIEVEIVDVAFVPVTTIRTFAIREEVIRQRFAVREEVIRERRVRADVNVQANVQLRADVRSGCRSCGRTRAFGGGAFFAGVFGSRSRSVTRERFVDRGR